MPATNPMPPPMETVTAKMSRWAANLQYKDLSAEAIYQAKRFLLDSFGCALGGYQQHEVKIALEVLDEIAAIGHATVIGTGRRIDPVSASLANALMIRCMDYNDIYWKQDPSHPSDIFPAAIACCERASGNGKELIVGMVLGHEFEMRLCEAAFPGIRERGWHHATLTAFVSPIVAGRALHLPWEQIQHAIGISASRHCTLGAVTAGKLTMMKNTVDPMATQSGVFAALLAEKGYSGPGACDGWKGRAGSRLQAAMEAGCSDRWAGRVLAHHAMRHEGLPNRGVDAHADLGCARSGQEQRPAAGGRGENPDPLAGPRCRHSLRSQQVRPAHQGNCGSFPAIMSSPLRWSTAKSLPRSSRWKRSWTRRFGSNCTKSKSSQIQKSRKYFQLYRGSLCKFTQEMDARFHKQLDFPKGDPRNPLTDQEIEEKFAALAEGVLSAPAQKRLKDAVWSLERVGSVSDLMALMKSDVRKARVGKVNGKARSRKPLRKRRSQFA